MQRNNENPTNIIIKYAINGAWIGASIPVCAYQFLAYLNPPGSFFSLTNSGEIFDFTFPSDLLFDSLSFNSQYGIIRNSFSAAKNHQSKHDWYRDKKIDSIYGFSLLAASGAVGGAAVGATIGTTKCITQQLYDAFIANRPTVSPKNLNRLMVGAIIAGAGVSFATGWGFFVGALWGGMTAKTVEVISKPCRKTS